MTALYYFVSKHSPFLRNGLSLVLLLAFLIGCSKEIASIEGTRPNILLIMSDDQSWEHISASGYAAVDTPNIDRIAREGLYFERAYAPSPTCTAARSAIISGQHTWKLGSAALLHGKFSSELISYQDLLANGGYEVAYTGKGWGPGVLEKRPTGLSPTGKSFNAAKRNESKQLGGIDLVRNFELFLEQRDPNKPFSFWVGSVEPHRPYDMSVDNRFNSEESYGGIPDFLPKNATVGRYLSAYLNEVEVFDNDVGALYEVLKSKNLLENTVIVVTSDNGMPFSRAKTQNYEYGVRVPLLIRWPGIRAPGRRINDLISLTDLAPTFLDLAGLGEPSVMTGKSLGKILASDKSGQVDPQRRYAFTTFERHSLKIREGENNLGYPRRAIHSKNFAYIRNYYHERWPVGDPPRFLEAYPGLLTDPATKKRIEPLFSLHTQKRPAQELYDLSSDPFQLRNIAGDSKYSAIRKELSVALCAEQRRTQDYILADDSAVCEPLSNL